MEDAAQHVGADMAQRILSGGPSLEQLEKGAAALPLPCTACGAAAAPAGPSEHTHHDLHATAVGPDEGAGDSDVECEECEGKSEGEAGQVGSAVQVVA